MGLLLVHREQEKKLLRLSSVAVETTAPRSGTVERLSHSHSVNASNGIERLVLFKN